MTNAPLTLFEVAQFVPFVVMSFEKPGDCE